MLNKKFIWQCCLAFFVFELLYITRYDLSFFDSIEWVQATDVYSYLVISSAAPNLPVNNISFHFAQRWLPHYMVGYLANLFIIDLATAYTICNGMVVLFILMISVDVLLRTTRDQTLGIFIYLLLSLSVFAFRLYIFVPSLLADLVFVLGLAVTLKGCESRRFSIIFLGILVATMGKQLALLVLPGVALYIYVIWKGLLGRVRAIVISVLLSLFVIAFNQVLIYTSASFALPNFINENLLFQFFPWVVSDQFTISLLIEHAFRTLLPLLPLILIWSLAPGGFSLKLKVLKNGEFLALVLMILGPMAYAFLPGPEVQMGNQSRYVGSVMLPLAILVLKTLPDIKMRLCMVDYFVLGTALLLLSYHHRYTMLQANPSIFLATQFLGMGVLASWMTTRKKAVFSQSTVLSSPGGQ